MPNIVEDILQIIRAGGPDTDEEFNLLALRLFQHQLAANPFYGNYCRSWAALSGASTKSAESNLAPETWRDIPAIPTAAFKQTEIRSFPAGDILTWFQTSGTTRNESGRHFFDRLDVYEAAILPNFQRHLLPDTQRMEMLFLIAPPKEAPHSSLSHMMQTVNTVFGDEKSAWYWSNNRLALDALFSRLGETEKEGKPVLLLGTAFAFVHFLDGLAGTGNRFQLPYGSRIMETGGYKGRAREMPRDELYRDLSRTLSIPVTNIINEYGMTELSSQFYDISLTEKTASAWKSMPPTARVQIVDPLTGQSMPDEMRGIIQVLDLANTGSVLCVKTEDTGVMQGDRFQVLGRIAQASPRGCSMGSEDALAAG